MSDLAYTDLLPLGPDTTPYRLLTTEGVRTVDAAGRTFLEVDPEALTLLTRTAFRDIAHWLRPGHLQQLRNILDDPEASANDRFVALDLLKNANIAAGGVLPMCQDTGRSEEHPSELQSLIRNSYAVFCLTKKNELIKP